MKAKGKRQKAKVKSADALRAQNFSLRAKNASCLRLLSFAFCPLPFAFRRRRLAFRAAACLLPFAFPEGRA
jgi:hypothetical protein